MVLRRQGGNELVQVHGPSPVGNDDVGHAMCTEIHPASSDKQAAVREADPFQNTGRNRTGDISFAIELIFHVCRVGKADEHLAIGFEGVYLGLVEISSDFRFRTPSFGFSRRIMASPQAKTA